MTQEFCTNGHLRTKENTSWVKRGDRPGMRRRCKDCTRKSNPIPQQRRNERIEDVEDLLSFGATFTEIIERSAYANWEGLKKALRVAHRADLLEALQAKLEVSTVKPPKRVYRRKPVCRVRECGRKRYAKGYCGKHYQVLWATGKPTKPKKPPRLCSVPGCGNKHLAKGYCNKHRQRLATYGDATFPLHQGFRSDLYKEAA